jgi:D-aminopeptidase
MKIIFKVLIFNSLLISSQIMAQTNKRAREFGIPFDGTTGKHNAITDVPGIQVGYKTKIEGVGKLTIGKGPVRTGVTVILPTGKSLVAVPAGWFSLNGDGEMTGTTYIEEYGLLSGPIGITNTNSVGIVRDAIGEWNVKNFSKDNLFDFSFGLPVVGETFDGLLNDINGFHITKEDVFDALNSAKSGSVAEGNVGGGTGMSLFLFKGGSGTSSRIIKINKIEYTLGVFVQGNFGGRGDLIVSGVPVGKELTGAKPVINSKEKDGSIIVIVATDAPLLPMQLKQIAKRVALGVAKTGGLGRNSSGDIFLAFSTNTPEANENESLQTWNSISKDYMDNLYKATIEATEEAIINALLAAETMEGINGNTLFSIPKEELKQIMKKYNRFNENQIIKK